MRHEEKENLISLNSYSVGCCFESLEDIKGLLSLTAHSLVRSAASCDDFHTLEVHTQL